MKKKAADQSRDELPETVSAFPDKSVEDIRAEDNPFTESDWRMLGYAWSGFILRVLLIVGGVFTVVQYIQARDEKRIERTLQLVEIWERPEYQTAQRELKRRIDTLNEQYAGLIGDNPTPEERRVYNERIGMEALSADGGAMPLAEFEEQFDRIVYFLNRVAFCVEGNLCKKSVADAFFKDFATSFWGYFAGHIERERRSGAPSYGKVIETYLTNEGGGWFGFEF